MIDLAGHLAYAVLLMGMILLTQEHRMGWVLRIVGELGWAVIGIFLGMSSLVIWGVAFAITDFYGYKKWRDRDVKVRRKIQSEDGAWRPGQE